MTTDTPISVVRPDSRGRVSLIKFLPPVRPFPVYLVYTEPENGVITLRPAPAGLFDGDDYYKIRQQTPIVGSGQSAQGSLGRG